MGTIKLDSLMHLIVYKYGVDGTASGSHKRIPP